MRWALAGLLLLAGQPTGALRLDGLVAGASGKHAIYVALWRAEGFLDRPWQQIRLAPGAPPAFHFEVPAGRYAVSAFEDLNDDGKLAQGLFGPKEPHAFWPPFKGWHKPRFEEVAFEVDRDLAAVEIVLR
ncbi:MAG: DUF2141 domain-containing protein [Myxococcales bacterium]